MRREVVKATCAACGKVIEWIPYKTLRPWTVCYHWPCKATVLCRSGKGTPGCHGDYLKRVMLEHLKNGRIR